MNKINIWICQLTSSDSLNKLIIPLILIALMALDYFFLKDIEENKVSGYKKSFYISFSLVIWPVSILHILTNSYRYSIYVIIEKLLPVMFALVIVYLVLSLFKEYIVILFINKK